MKVGKVLLVLLFAAITSYAQNKSLGVGTPTPNANAALHVESPTSNQGFIMPRLTTVQRTGMGSLLTAADNGLMLYDTDLKTIFIWDGVVWKSSAQVAGGVRLTLPYQDSVLTAPAGSNLLKLFYGGTAPGNVGLAYVENINPLNGFAPLFARTNGTGAAAQIIVNNSSNTNAALAATTNGTGPAVRAINTGAGNGFAGFFNNSNAANTFPAIQANSNGTGSAIRAFQGTTNGDGPGMDIFMQKPTSTSSGLVINGNHAGEGVRLNMNTTTSTASGINVNQQGLGSAGVFSIANATSTAPALSINHTGTGNAIQTTGKIQAGQFIGDGIGLTNVKSIGLSYPFKDSVTTALAGNDVFALKYNNAVNKRVLRVESLSPTNGGSAVSVLQNGTGIGIFSRVDNAAAGTSAIYGTTNSNLGGALPPVGVYGESTGTGSNAGAFRISNAANNFPAVYAETNGIGPTFTARQIGAGNASAGSFRVTGTTNTGAAIYSQTDGTGAAIQGQTSTGFTAVYGRREGATNGNAGLFDITDGANTFPSLQSNTVGTGAAGNFKVTNGSNTGPAVMGETNGGNLSSGVYGLNTGNGFGILGRANGTSFGSAAVYGEQLGTGDVAGAFRINNPSNSMSGLYGETNGSGSALFANNIGTGGRGAQVQINNAANSQAALRVFTNGTGNVGFFTLNNTASTANALFMETNGNGSNGIFVNHTGSSGSLLVLQSASANVARIDKTGKGFFNGGTQTGGADLAEMFDVEGSRQNYEPGDVLVISETSDRTVEKSSAANSSKVVGVYATKPGVTLTEKGMDENLDELVPMGVIGVIPTKVCLENGPIKRGDLLVTSSKQGHAMKAMPVNVGGVLIYPAGAILGKALENFDSQESGLIKVLVNVK
jgi:hypothetical protein